ncbi:LysM peptidoglycan-binding domain-containing protein [Candidatus Leptofilum sp.]|uniref:LysM peptidoglycan-binding domain-containing protein n=1 Tax=Candidatus Leptofilum sp. TaxID=3241576 RepID=UPI003B5CE27B
MSEAPVEQSEVKVQPTPEDTDVIVLEPDQADERRGELLKFAILAIILLFTVLIIALLRPYIFNTVIPAVLGEGQPAAPLVESDAEAETIKPEAEEEEEAASDEEPDEAENNEAEEVTEEGAETEEEPVNPEDFPTAVPAQTHTVQPGETLTAIARQYNTTVQTLVTANNIANPDRVTVSTVLTIPDGQ